MEIKNLRVVSLPNLDVTELRSILVNYWNATALCDELGGAFGSLVRETEIKVSELLEMGDASSLYEAMRITAQFDYERRVYFNS